ncbi:hypothetical protein DFH29DRAFT_1083282 [Suillus ampliporus]|nr:hypothetical protein DFH29DRAFT_1083282 [Suillus ampliporus]
MTLLPSGAVLLYIPLVCASLSSLNGTSVHTLDAASDCPSCHARTLPHIIWSCAATLFACAWTAIHPNIPGMGDGKVAITSRRLFIMIMALIAPELIVTWAAAQFFSARAAAKDFNRAFGAKLERDQVHDDHIPDSIATLLSEIPESDGRHSQNPSAPRPEKFRGWTVTHGFFAWMGGFMLYVNNKPRATLTPGELLHFVREGSVDMPDITEADVEDRSKGDGLSKAIAIIQLLWFVLQLITRYVQNLPTTLLFFFKKKIPIYVPLRVVLYAGQYYLFYGTPSVPVASLGA